MLDVASVDRWSDSALLTTGRETTSHRRHVRGELRPEHRKSWRRDLPLGRARVGAIDSPAQELRFEERVERRGAGLLVESPEPQRLTECQAQSRHLKILSANPVE